MQQKDIDDIQHGIRIGMQIAGETAEEKGFWENKNPDERFAECIALIHSELSEALEAHRKEKTTGEDNVFEELADATIRIFDLAYHFEIYSRYNEPGIRNAYFDIELTRKMKKNLNRDYKHGKRY